jgi:hypothetical protein
MVHTCYPALARFLTLLPILEERENAQITEGEKVLEFVSAGEDRFSPENLLPAL